jgi:hypothetical protein
MSAAASVPGHNLVLECYHPSAKTSTPYFHSDYLGTHGLDDVASRERGNTGLGHLGLGDLGQMYSRFRPVVQDEARRPRVRYPRRTSHHRQHQQHQHEDGPAQAVGEVPESAREVPSQEIHLEEGESFSQLCTLANLGKLGPRRGIYLSHVNLNDSVIRVWREWLATMADSGPGTHRATEGKGNTNDPAILWADTRHDVGVRFRVVEAADSEVHKPVLRGVHEDAPIAYTLEYLGQSSFSFIMTATLHDGDESRTKLTAPIKELLVRTRKLLLAMEESEVMQTSNSGNALILFGS